MLRWSRRSDLKSRSAGEEKRKTGECNNKEKLCSKKKRHQRRLLREPLLKVIFLIWYHLCFQHSTKRDSSMTQLNEVCGELKSKIL